MDFEMSNSANSKKKATADTSGTGTPDIRNETAASSSASSVQAANSTSKAPAGGAKDPAPATSRKRKAAGAPASTLHTPVSSTPPPSGARKNAASTAAPPSYPMARETNIMTFSKCRSTLNKKGELAADDGAKLSVNGKPACSSLI
jgi:hypothetical protein